MIEFRSEPLPGFNRLEAFRRHRAVHAVLERYRVEGPGTVLLDLEVVSVKESADAVLLMVFSTSE